MLERLQDGEFVGMYFNDVLIALEEREVVPTTIEEPEENYLGVIVVGSFYSDYYMIDFNGMGICDCCYHGTCEE